MASSGACHIASTGPISTGVATAFIRIGAADRSIAETVLESQQPKRRAFDATGPIRGAIAHVWGWRRPGLRTGESPSSRLRTARETAPGDRDSGHPDQPLDEPSPAPRVKALHELVESPIVHDLPLCERVTARSFVCENDPCGPNGGTDRRLVAYGGLHKRNGGLGPTLTKAVELKRQTNPLEPVPTSKRFRNASPWFQPGAGWRAIRAGKSIFCSSA
jgi:hypothetical protein